MYAYGRRGTRVTDTEVASRLLMMWTHRNSSLALALFLVSTACVSSVEAAMITAASCSHADVSTAIAAAADGDTVRIPPCAATTWTSGITVTDKAINITGAGIDVTTIALAGGTGFITFSGTSSGNHVGQIGNLTVAGSGSDSFIEIESTYRFRVHHLKIGDVSPRAIKVTGSSGLIDHMEFTTVDGYNAIQILGGTFTPTGRWSEDMNFGSADQVYIEDSTFTATNCVTSFGVFDGFNGSRMVFRHNTVTNWAGYVHGYDTSSESALQWEIHDNFFDMLAPDCAISRLLFMRGGTGYVYNNTMHLTDPYDLYEPQFVGLYYYRGDLPQQGSICDGTADIDENRPGQNGYLCFQQPGSGGPGPHTSVPIYEYNNVGTGNMPTNVQLNSESSYVVSGRDFFNDTQKPGYSAYTYPHPLTASSRLPTAPSNLRIGH
jgi:hypothetical protein